MDRGNAIVRERALRDAVLAGDATAWRAWYDEHFARLAAYVNWRCGGRADLADDVLQETWLVAVRRLKKFDPARGTFASWLAGIAANAVRNALRTWNRQRRRGLPLDAATEPAAKENAAPENARRVAATLAAINPLYEEVLRAKYLDRQSVEMIATERGETVKAIESRLTRARQAFRELYETNHD
ncbi:MAG TPA: RNA polymerase sigma factor [Urbifossiella sp.]|nr:RNA polymerase sigma factor [Urbifossiella sp.]